MACQTLCWEQAYRGMVPDVYLDHPDLGAARAARWARRLAGERVVHLTEIDDRVVGVVSAGPSPEPPGLELLSLYVERAFYGTGTADDLLRAAVGSAPARLWVFRANLRARRFYARHGFRPTGFEQADPDTGVVEMLLTRGARAAVTERGRID